MAGKTPYTTPLGTPKAPEPAPVKPRRWPWVLACVVLVGVLAGLGLAIQWGVSQLMKSPRFAIERLELANHSVVVPVEQVQQVVQKTLHGNYFSANLQEVHDALKKLPWIKTVWVARRWPNRLVVGFQTYEAFAKDADGGLIDPNGVVFEGSLDKLPQLAQSLPTLSGPNDKMQDVVQAWRHLSELVAPLHVKITHLDYSDRGAWSLVFEGEPIPATPVRLGQVSGSQLDRNVENLVKVYPEIVEKLGGFPQSLDLRYNEAVAVGLPQDAQHLLRTPQPQK